MSGWFYGNEVKEWERGNGERWDTVDFNNSAFSQDAELRVHWILWVL